MTENLHKRLSVILNSLHEIRSLIAQLDILIPVQSNFEILTHWHFDRKTMHLFFCTIKALVKRELVKGFGTSWTNAAAKIESPLPLTRFPFLAEDTKPAPRLTYRFDPAETAIFCSTAQNPNCEVKSGAGWHYITWITPLTLAGCQGNPRARESERARGKRRARLELHVIVGAKIVTASAKWRLPRQKSARQR